MTDEELRRAEHRLLAGAATYACGGYIVRLDALHRNDLYTRLAYDRLERKYDVVRELFAESDSNWNQTFYVLLFRTIGDVTNRDAFLTLARRVSYRMVLRERASLHAVEAMLIGASGLLDNYRDDTYTRSLKQDFDYFSRKYEIAPMTGAEWNLRDIRPANHPLLRIAQLAAFLASNDFLIDRLVECRTAEEVRRLIFGRSFRLLVHPLHSGDTHPRAAQAHREDEVRPVGHQPRLPDPVRLRCLQRQRAAARAGLRAARSHSRRGEPLHAPLASLRSASGQRLPVAGIAATGHRILRPAPLRGVSGGSPPAGSAQTVRPRRRIPQPTLTL